MTARVVVLTSRSLRHRYFAQTMAGAFDVVAAFSEAKKNYYDATRQQSEPVREHFRQLDASEQAEFAARLGKASLEVGHGVDDINDPALIAQAKASGAEVALLFGTSILKQGWLDAFPDRIVNLHLGLSPFYRGAATLFWPLANGELECVGTTIHLAAEKVDAGAILARIKADPRPGDTYYSLTNRLIRRSIDAIPSIVQSLLAGETKPESQEAFHVRSYRMTDFDETALSRMLAFFGSGLSEGQIAEAMRSQKCSCSP
jgi:methionyl-tRNA formyltransferase